jgi:hypothetical protein
MHVATSQGMLPQRQRKMRSKIAAATPPEARSRKELLDAFSQSIANAKDTLQKMGDFRLMSMRTGTRNGKAVMPVPRTGLIRAILMNHLYGPSADKNPFA